MGPLHDYTEPHSNRDPHGHDRHALPWITPPSTLLRDTGLFFETLNSTRLQIKKVSTANCASASLSSLSLRIPHLHTSKRGVDAGRGLMSAPTRCPEEDQHACHLRLPFAGPCRVSTPLRRGGNGEEVRTCGVCAMDQILLRRSRDEHTPARSSAERIPSHLSVACAEACDIVPPFLCFSLMIF